MENSPFDQIGGSSGDEFDPPSPSQYTYEITIRGGRTISVPRSVNPVMGNDGVDTCNPADVFGANHFDHAQNNSELNMSPVNGDDATPIANQHPPHMPTWPQYESGDLPMPNMARGGNNYQFSDQPPVADIDAFGTLVTPDSEFLITTRTVIIGRNQVAFKRYKALHQWEEKKARAEALGEPPPDPPAKFTRGRPHAAPSSSGGLLPEELIHRPSARRRKGLGLHDQFLGNEEVESGQDIDHTPNSAHLDLNKHRPGENHVARLFIHGQGPKFYATTKGISREHLKIQYDSSERIWEAHALGRNGFFCDDVLIKEGDKVTLVSGCALQIQNIPIFFLLKNVAEGKDGSDLAYSENGKSMSFDFTSSHHGHHGLAGDTDDEMDDAPNATATLRGEELDEYAVDDEDAGEDNSENIRETVEKQEQSPDAEQLAQVPYLPRKRGPGRPPKNGIMSKREEKLLRKQQQEEAKKNLPLDETSEQALKRKAARLKKGMDELEGSAEKRPYKARKLKGEDGTEDPEGDKPTKERSQKHKTPPLELRREDFTEEQLQKPTKNYQLLIDEVMATAPEKGYSLKQIYKRIQEKWPHFYFRVDTKGWESSVRHNLLGSDCFKKVDGNWHRVAGVPLDAGKKRKPSDSTAESRPVMYNNGYGQPSYQHHQPGQPSQPPHGRQPIAHSTGLGQPNLPPRYPPNGQAYQIHQGPHPGPNQPGGPLHPQGPPRPGFPQHQVPASGTGGAFVPAGPPRQFSGSQPPAYGPNYGRAPPPPNPFLPEAGGTSGLNNAHRPPVARPGVGPPSQQNVPVSHTNSAMGVRGAAVSIPQHLQPSPVSLEPIIDPVLRDHVRKFRTDVGALLSTRLGKKAGPVTMSIISRGCKLTNRSLFPEAKDYEQEFLAVFRRHMMDCPKLHAQVVANRQGNKGHSAKGLGTSTAVAASGSSGALSIVGAASVKAGAAANTPATGPKPSTPIPVTSTSTTPASATAVRPSPGPAPGQKSNVGSAASEPKSAIGEAALGGPERAIPNVPGSVPTAAASTTNTASKPVTTGLAAENAGPKAAHDTAPEGALAAHKTVNSAQPPWPATSNTATSSSTLALPGSASTAVPAGPNASRPASAAPSPGLSTSNPNTASQAPAGRAASTPSSAVAPVSGGAPRLLSSTPGPAAGAPALGTSRTTPTTPMTPGTPDENIQILDPKLVEVILAFKMSILPTVANKIGANLTESLILSAVCRKLGFTDDTFVLAGSEQQRKDLADAEKTLMQFVETRFKNYQAERAKEP